MVSDLKIKTDECNFKGRVNGIILKEGKILTVQINNNGFYCLPGGHIELGEDSRCAVIREIKEEVGVDIKVEKLLSIAENFFVNNKGKNMHEISFYYLVSPIQCIETKDWEIIEHDKNQDVLLQFKWFDLNEINNIDFRPNFIKDKLFKKDLEFVHQIIKNNKLI